MYLHSLDRLDDISVQRNRSDCMRSLRSLQLQDIDTEIIAASVRNPIHVTDCALAGADIATVPLQGNRADDTSSVDRRTELRNSRLIIRLYFGE